MINIQNLSFHYKSGRPIYSGVNMELRAGNIYGLLGENGVGKTTLLKLISGLLFPTGGECNVLGFNPKHRDPNMLKQIYLLPEFYTLPKMTMRDYVRLYAPFYPKFDHLQLADYVKEFGLAEAQKLSEFSHGQQKKWLIAFGLATNTELLLMDEPTNGLDIPSKTIFRQLMAKAMSDDKTMVISTHQVRDLENLIDPIIILEHNQVLLNNSIDEITQKLKFVIAEKPSATALYSEPAMGGFACVEQNADGTETKVNIEQLFNAAISNKDLFKRLFIKN